MKAHDVLVKARALIADPERWIKKTMKDDEGRMCMVQAIKEVDAIGVGGVDAIMALERYTQMPPSKFNDLDKTTHADVIRIFDQAIERTK